MYGGSLIVVGQTFEELVLQPAKDVFLLVYASWCGFSRKFMPIWEEFAIRAAHVTSLLVMKIDGDLNSSPLREEGFDWRSYPTVFFVKAGTKVPIAFDGERTVEQLSVFANDHGSQRFVIDPTVDQDKLSRALNGDELAEL